MNIKKTLRKHDIKYVEFLKTHRVTIYVGYFKKILSKYAKWKNSYTSIFQTDQKHLEIIYRCLNDNNIMPIKYVNLDTDNIAATVKS